jgi:hypothetical protein
MPDRRVPGGPTSSGDGGLRAATSTGRTSPLTVEPGDLAPGRPAVRQVRRWKSFQMARHTRPGSAPAAAQMFKRPRRWENGSVHQLRARRACLPLRTAAHHQLAGRRGIYARTIPQRELEIIETNVKASDRHTTSSVPGAGKPGAASGLRGLVNCYKTGRPSSIQWSTSTSRR